LVIHVEKKCNRQSYTYANTRQLFLPSQTSAWDTGFLGCSGEEFSSHWEVCKRKLFAKRATM
jgi:hypothetical protein